MMTLRTFDARMQMAQRQGKTSFYMQHMGEEAVSCAFRKALVARRHEFPDLPPGRPADRRRLSDGRHDEPDLFQRARPAEGPATAGHVFAPRSTASSRSPATSRRNTSRPSAGRWPRRSSNDTKIAAGWIGDGSTAEIGFPRGAGLRLDLQGAGRPQHRQQPVGDLDLPGHRARRLRHVRRARPGLRHSRAARSTATTISPSMPWRNGRSSGRAAISGRRWSNTSPIASAPIPPRTIPRPTGRRRNPTPGRSATRCCG